MKVWMTPDGKIFSDLDAAVRYTIDTKTTANDRIDHDEESLRQFAFHQLEEIEVIEEY